MAEKTIWQHMKENWIIKKSTIKNLGINPDKDWYQITLEELDRLSTELDVTIGELVHYLN